MSGFSFSNPSNTDHVAGWGHTHVFLDGQLLGMSYEPLTHIEGLDPGPHQATVTLSRNDHTDYSLDGREKVSIGDLVELVVQTDAADSVHVHGYDLLLDLEAGSSETLRFEADIPGVFEIELEETGVLLQQLQVS